VGGPKIDPKTATKINKKQGHKSTGFYDKRVQKHEEISPKIDEQTMKVQSTQNLDFRDTSAVKT
jgi:hypothetical protein